MSAAAVSGNIQKALLSHSLNPQTAQEIIDEAKTWWVSDAEVSAAHSAVVRFANRAETIALFGDFGKEPYVIDSENPRDRHPWVSPAYLVETATRWRRQGNEFNALRCERAAKELSLLIGISEELSFKFRNQWDWEKSIAR